jgi:tRNA threonylcarbamoyladenosine biosynthesis protein TsaB
MMAARCWESPPGRQTVTIRLNWRLRWTICCTGRASFPLICGLWVWATGPGAFTSLRIGLAFVKGLALALRLPVAGVPSLTVLATSQPVQDMVMAAALQVGRGRLAVGWFAPVYGKWLLQNEPQLMTAEDLARQIKNPTLVCGELNAADRQVLARKRKNVILASPAQSLRRPAFLAELAWQRWQTGEVDEVVSLSPIYLRTAQEIPS